MQQWSLAVLAALLVCASVAPAVATPSSDEHLAEDGCAFPVKATDASGATVNISEEPERVVTLNPSAAQIMWEIGAEDKVVGVTKHATNLEGAENRTSISTDGETINPEIVADLEPDLVLAPSSQMVTDELVELLREVGLTVYHYPSAESIDDVRERTLLTGQLVGECEGAEETVEWMDRELEIVEAALEGQDRPTVLYVFFGFTAGENTFIHEVIEASGGANVAAEVGISEYQQVNDEMVLKENPDWIVLNTNSPEIPDSEAYAETTAVRENQTVVVNINHLNRPGPRVVHAITELAETFHPDAYADARTEIEATDSAPPTDASDEAETTDSANESSDSESLQESDGPDDPEDQPGFGAFGGLVALAVALLVAKHRSSRRPSGRA